MLEVKLARGVIRFEWTKKGADERVSPIFHVFSISAASRIH